MMARAELISPELVLVSPELRERALVALPAVDADALFAVEARRAPQPRAEAGSERHDEPAAEDEVVSEAPFAVALLSYVGEAVLLGALRGAAMFAAVAVVAFVLAR